MKENITYGKCLSHILQAINLKSSKLAREINIDSSLVYKWLRNERVPSTDSPYIDLILKSVEKRITMNSCQKESIISILTKHEIPLFDESDLSILNGLKAFLQNSQGHSIRLRNKMKSQYKLFSDRISSVANFIENIESRSELAENHNPCDISDFHDTIKDVNLFCGRDNVQIIKGSEAVLYSVINLLRQSPITPHSGDNTILITINSDYKHLFGSKEINNIWIQTLQDLLYGGWKIIFHVKLDSNVNRTIKIIEYIQALLAAGNITVYYDKQHTDFSYDTELCIIPQTGALYSFSTNNRNQIDNAFLFHSRKSIEMLTERYFHDLNFSQPLLRSYPSPYTPEYHRAFAEAEESPGDKYLFKGGLSTITIPLELYEKYLKSESKSSQEISERLSLHKRRLDAFEAQIDYFKFKDICFIESLDTLVDKKRYSFDENYILKYNAPDYKDIICHLENLIKMLKKHENYNIAFVSKAHLERMSNIFWVVKGKNCVLMETFRLDQSEKDHFHSEMNFIITEKLVVNAFQDYFLILWDNIPEENKNKRNTIAWLKSLIKICIRRAEHSPDQELLD